MSTICIKFPKPDSSATEKDLRTMERTKEEAEWRASRPIGTWSGAAFMAEIAAFAREQRKDIEAYLDIAATRG
jgi:hypothetical protein